ncbi:MAG: histidine kinase N-terminal 7TM domain-containing protein [Anaerolineae bacterium]
MGILITFLLGLAAVALGYVGGVVWRRRQTTGARYLVWVMLGGIVWTLFYLLEIRSGSFPVKVFWAKAKYLGIVVIPVGWFLFIAEYLGMRDFMWPYSVKWLLVIPALTLVALATNPWHHLFWRSLVLRPCGENIYLEAEHTLFFWLHTVYSNLLLLGSAVMLLRALLRSHSFYRAQVLVMMGALLFPWASNILYLTDAMPCALRDPTPLAFLLTGVITTVGTLRFRWLDLVPVARAVVLETMHDGVIVVDGQERIVDLNPAAAAAFGDAVQALIGKPISDRLPVWTEIADAGSPELEVPESVVLGEGKDARVYEVYVSSLDQGRDGGLRFGHVVMLHDITEHMRAVQEREQLIRDLDAFAYMVAHDLKNPVGTMATAANLLYDEGRTLPPESLEVLAQVIVRGTKKALNIIDELLLLAGVQKGAEVVFQPLDMMVIVEETLQRLDQVLEKADAQVITPERWPVALGHAPWVEEVWANYISNAVKYGGTPPRVELGADPPADGQVRFWVQDNGPGLEDVDVETLFEPFTRLSQVHVSGHGLGLSIVRHIVERLGGEVGVDCGAGEGCRFYFTLPAAEPDVDTAEEV